MVALKNHFDSNVRTKKNETATSALLLMCGAGYPKFITNIYIFYHVMDQVRTTLNVF